jgi:hypothetical protein
MNEHTINNNDKRKTTKQAHSYFLGHFLEQLVKQRLVEHNTVVLLFSLLALLSSCCVCVSLMWVFFRKSAEKRCKRVQTTKVNAIFDSKAMSTANSMSIAVTVSQTQICQPIAEGCANNKDVFGPIKSRKQMYFIWIV